MIPAIASSLESILVGARAHIRVVLESKGISGDDKVSQGGNLGNWIEKLVLASDTVKGKVELFEGGESSLAICEK